MLNKTPPAPFKLIVRGLTLLLILFCFISSFLFIKPVKPNQASITTTAKSADLTAISTKLLVERFTEIVKPASVQSLDLIVTKSLNDGIPAPGEEIEYRIVYNNAGSATATGVVITDVLPANVIYLADYNSVGFTTTLTGSTVIWRSVPLGAGASGSIFLQVKVLSNTIPGDVLTNVVMIDTNGADANPDDNVFTLTTSVLNTLRDLSISKSISGLAGTPGGEMLYQLYYANEGELPAANVVITDTLPTEVSYVSSYNYSGFNTTVNGNTVIFTRTEVNPGSSGYLYIWVSLADTLNVGDTLENNVEISTTDRETNLTDNQFALETTVISSTWDLQITKDIASGVPLPGNEVEYVLNYHNLGNVVADNVRITDTLPTSSSYVLDYNTANFTTILTGSQVVWHKDSVPVGGEGYLYVRMHIPETLTSGTVLTNVAEIRSINPDSNPLDNHTIHTSTIKLPATDLAIAKTLSGTLGAPGSQMRYVITFTNQGNLTATNVVITETLPISTTALGWSGYVFNPEPANLALVSDFMTQTLNSGQIGLIWELEPIIPGAIGLIDLTIHVGESYSGGAILTNVVEISNDSLDSNLGNNYYTLPLTLDFPTRNMVIFKSLDSAPPPPGRNLVYEIYFRNTANLPARNVFITDTLPTYLTYLSWNGHLYNPDYTALPDNIVQVNGKRIVWDIGTLEANAEGFIYLTAKTADTLIGGEILTNSVKISTSDVEVTQIDNSALQETSVVSPTENLEITHQVDGATGTPGGTMVYKLDYWNYGPADATNVLITFTLPNSTTYLQSYDEQAILDGSLFLNTLVWTRSIVKVGAGGSLFLQVALDDQLQVGQVLTSHVAILGDGVDLTLSNNQHMLFTTLISKTWDLRIYKFLEGIAGYPGGQMDYGILYQNKGNWPATNVVISDTLPSYLTHLSNWNSYGFTSTVTSDSLIFKNPRIEAGDFGYLYLRVAITDTLNVNDIVINTVKINSDNQDANPSDNVYVDRTQLIAPTRDISIRKEVYAGTLEPDSQIVYRLTYENEGNLPAANIIITDDLPDKVIYISHGLGSFSPVITGDIVVWNKPSLEIGEQGLLTITAYITPGLERGEILKNVANISTEDDEINYQNNVSTVVSIVGGVFKLYMPLVLK